MSGEYGDKYDGPVLFVIVLFMIAMTVFTISLIASHTPDCRSSNLTYCGHESNY